VSSLNDINLGEGDASTSKEPRIWCVKGEDSNWLSCKNSDYHVMLI